MIQPPGVFRGPHAALRLPLHSATPAAFSPCVWSGRTAVGHYLGYTVGISIPPDLIWHTITGYTGSFRILDNCVQLLLPTITMPRCIVLGCDTRSGKKDKAVVLHAFPKSKEDIKRWLSPIAGQFKDIDQMVDRVAEANRRDFYTMCSKHFEQGQYMHHPEGRKVLRFDAYPSIVPASADNVPGTYRFRRPKRRFSDMEVNTDPVECADMEVNTDPMAFIKIQCPACGTRFQEYIDVLIRAGETNEMVKKKAKAIQTVPQRALQYHKGAVPQRVIATRDQSESEEEDLLSSDEDMPFTEEHLGPIVLRDSAAKSGVSQLLWGELASTPVRQPLQTMTQRVVEKLNVRLLEGGHIPTNPPKSCRNPLDSQKCSRMTQEHQAPSGEGILMRQCKEEEIPVDISSGNNSSMNPPEKEDGKMIPQESQAVARDKVLPSRCKEEPHPSEIILGPPTSWKVQPESPHVLVPVCHKNGDNPSNLEGSITNDVHPIALIVKPQTVLNLIPTLIAKTDQQPRLFKQGPKEDTSSSSPKKFGGGDVNELSVVHECLLCGESFGNEINLIAHEQMFHCALCQKCFKDKSTLVVHQWAFHMPKPNIKESQTKCEGGSKEYGPFSCIECGKSFLNKSNYNRHQRIHTGAFTCPDCGKCLTDRTGLIRHRRTRTSEWPFACADCGRRFTRRYHLISHQSVHKKSFVCSDCGKLFSVRSILEAHQAFHNQYKVLNHGSAKAKV